MLYLLLYNIFLRSYALGIKAAALKNDKAKKWINGRKNIFSEVEDSLRKTNSANKRIWMHVASLGEFEQGRPLIEKIKANHPETIIILTFFSPSGYEMRKNYPFADFVFYLPLDDADDSPKFIKILRPDLAIFVKYEFWYYYFKALHDKQIPLILLSAVFRKDQPFFSWYGALHRKMLQYVTHFFVQDKASVELLVQQNIKNITQIPDTRIDRVFSVKQSIQPIPIIERFLNGKEAFLGGSVYDTENEFLANAYFSGRIQDKIIIAPHNINADYVAKLAAKWGNEVMLLSQLNNNQIPDKNVLIVDSIGLLNSLYQYAKFAIIGGGFGKSIHNILEPAAFGVPILFGPNNYKFKEAQDLKKSGGAFEISNQKEFDEFISILYSNVFAYELAAKASKDYIQENTGGTGKVYIWLREKMLL